MDQQIIGIEILTHHQNFQEYKQGLNINAVEVGGFKKARVHALNRVDLKVSTGKTISMVRDIAALSPRQRRSVQKDLQMIFQDPYSSLNPRKKIRYILARPGGGG